MAKNISNLPPRTETDAEWALRIKMMMRIRIENGIQHEKGTALALIMKIAKDIIDKAPIANTNEVLEIGFSSAGEEVKQA